MFSSWFKSWGGSWGRSWGYNPSTADTHDGSDLTVKRTKTKRNWKKDDVVEFVRAAFEPEKTDLPAPQEQQITQAIAQVDKRDYEAELAYQRAVLALVEYEQMLIAQELDDETALLLLM